MVHRSSTLAVSLVMLVTLSPAPGEARERAPGDLGVPLVALKRAVESSALVVVGAQRGFKRRSSRATVYVTAGLKGEAGAGQRIVVDFEKAPIGTWPKRGVRTLLCLSRGKGEGSYQLASYYGSVLPATDGLTAAVRGMLAGQVAPPERARGVEPPPPGEAAPLPRVELAEEYADRVVESETVLVGALSDIRPSSKGFLGTFSVEEAVVGYGAFKAPVRVEFASGGGRGGARPPEAGRYVLFLRGSETGDGFRVIPRGEGAVGLGRPASQKGGGDDREAKIKRAVRALADRMGPNRQGLTTVQATLAEWQDAWNARDLERCIRCYSVRNALRKRYEDGGDGRSSLAEQIKSYPGTLRIAVQRVERSRVFAARGRQTATATVLLTLAPRSPAAGKGEGEAQDRRTAKMKFVREEREWLILEEGF